MILKSPVPVDLDQITHPRRYTDWLGLERIETDRFHLTRYASEYPDLDVWGVYIHIAPNCFLYGNAIEGRLTNTADIISAAMAANPEGGA